MENKEFKFDVLGLKDQSKMLQLLKISLSKYTETLCFMYKSENQ